MVIIWLVVFRPTPLKNDGLSSSVGMLFHSQYFLGKSWDIPWFQSPSRCHFWRSVKASDGDLTMTDPSEKMGKPTLWSAEVLLVSTCPWNVHGSGALVKDDGKVQGGDVSILNLRPANNPGGVWRYFLSREWRNIGKTWNNSYGPTVLCCTLR